MHLLELRCQRLVFRHLVDEYLDRLRIDRNGRQALKTPGFPLDTKISFTEGPLATFTYSVITGNVSTD